MLWLKLNRSTRSSVVALAVLVLVSLLNGCATSSPKATTAGRPFVFAQDTFSFSNELSWEYFFDANGKWTSQRREPKPDYSQHCFVVSRAAKQFFKFAEFDPAAPVTDEKTYRARVQQIISRGDRSPVGEKTILPGYANLKQFSREHEELLKSECGGAWRSYFQRGHWRMILPFSRNHQERASEEFVDKLKRNEVLVVHLVRFPKLSINHAVMLVGYRETEQGIEFLIYDPNRADKAEMMKYDRATRTFLLPANTYFHGGKVNVYEIYRSCFY